MSLQAYLAFVAACIALALLPGPVVTLLIANGLRHGTRAALINCAGAQAGLAIVIGIVAVGLTSLMATMGYWFDWVRFAGAAYLVWLGIKLIRTPVEGISVDEKPAPPRGGFFLQGFLVLLSNPKVLVFFGAFIPQFIDPAANPALQFDRQKARGMRLDIAAGTAVRFEPGQSREVTLVAFAGERKIYGFRQNVMGKLD